jgi:ADP-ribose pyrophosphatase YjhB (NUDIX family)
METKHSDDTKRDRDRDRDKEKDEHSLSNNNSYKYNLRNVYCVNCGEKGHVLKECDGPITSFGIIAFKTCKDEADCVHDTNPLLKDILTQLKIDNNTEYPKIKFLMIQRKDTMGYIDFVRGKYDVRPGYEKERDQKIRVCLDEMTQKEKDNLLTKDFDTIWNDLWVNHDSKCFKNEYDLAKKKYMNLNVPDLVKKSSTTYVFQEFGFPKGRRNMKETNIACAEREFYEETGYDKDCYDFIKNYPIIKEEFVGTNNVEYRHIYYLVKIKDRVPPPKIDIYNKVQTGEVRNIGWFTLDECLHLIRPYDIAKKNMIKSVSKDIENMNAQYNCSKIFFASSTRREETFSSAEIYNKLCDRYTNGAEYLIDTNS